MKVGDGRILSCIDGYVDHCLIRQLMERGRTGSREGRFLCLYGSILHFWPEKETYFLGGVTTVVAISVERSRNVTLCLVQSEETQVRFTRKCILNDWED